MSDSNKAMSGGMRFALDMGPLLVFFGSYFQVGIYWATGLFMAASTISLVVYWHRLRKIPANLIVTTAVVVVFGALTLYLQDDRFIKIKPTIIYSLFSGALLGGVAVGRPVIKLVLGTAFPPMLHQGWVVMSIRWGVFFALMAVLNEVVWRNFSMDFWVSFKLFGFLPLTFAFAISQAGLVKRYGIPDAENSS